VSCKREKESDTQTYLNCDFFSSLNPTRFSHLMSYAHKFRFLKGNMERGETDHTHYNPNKLNRVSSL